MDQFNWAPHNILMKLNDSFDVKGLPLSISGISAMQYTPDMLKETIAQS